MVTKVSSYVLFILLLTACAQIPHATGEVAQAVSSATQATTASTVHSIVNQDINVPLNYVVLVAICCWFIRTPFGMIADFITAIRHKTGRL